MELDTFYLARAFELARRGRFTTTPNPNVGCVIVRNKNIVGEGYHKNTGDLHAEIYALRMAGVASRGATAYITLEPCNHYGRTPPCTDALIKAGINRVVAAMSDPNPKVAGRGFDQLQKAGIEVIHGLMLKEAEDLNLGFLKRMRTGLPWIKVKMAASLDGRTAMSSGESQWITSHEARQDVQCLRAESDAILSTSSTVLADNPALTVRWTSLPKDIQSFYLEKKLRQPVRIIIDSTNRITPFHRVIKEQGQTWLARLYRDNLAWPSSVEQLKIPIDKKYGQNKIDLIALMLKLGKRNINTLLVEAGAELAGALVNAQLIDELILYQAPKLLGSDAYPLCIFSGLKKLSEAPEFKLKDIRKIGLDIRLSLKLKKNTE